MSKTVTKILFITLLMSIIRTKNGRHEINFSIGHASSLMQPISHKYPIEFFNSFKKQFTYIQSGSEKSVKRLKIENNHTIHGWNWFLLNSLYFFHWFYNKFPIEHFCELIDCFDFVARNFVANKMVCKPFSNNIEMRIVVFGHDRLAVQCLGT